MSELALEPTRRSWVATVTTINCHHKENDHVRNLRNSRTGRSSPIE